MCCHWLLSLAEAVFSMKLVQAPECFLNTLMSLRDTLQGQKTGTVENFLAVIPAQTTGNRNITFTKLDNDVQSPEKHVLLQLNTKSDSDSF